MEFATEMLIKASLTRAKIVEVPITLHPDGRKAHAPHLKTFRDGWRTLRFFLICTPKWLFLIPGLVCVGLGTLGYCLSLPGTKVLGVILDVHTLLCSSLAILCGWQAIVFAICTKTFAIKAGFLPRDTKLDRFFRIINLERGLGIACLMLICGLGLIGWTLNEWRIGGFGFLDYPRTMRLVVPGATLTALGFQTILASFLVGILGTDRR